MFIYQIVHLVVFESCQTKTSTRFLLFTKIKCLILTLAILTKQHQEMCHCNNRALREHNFTGSTKYFETTKRFDIRSNAEEIVNLITNFCQWFWTLELKELNKRIQLISSCLKHFRHHTKCGERHCLCNKQNFSLKILIIILNSEIEIHFPGLIFEITLCINARVCFNLLKQNDIDAWVKLVASTIIDKIPGLSPDILKVIVKFDTNLPVFLLIKIQTVFWSFLIKIRNMLHVHNHLRNLLQ